MTATADLSPPRLVMRAELDPGLQRKTWNRARRWALHSPGASSRGLNTPHPASAPPHIPPPICSCLTPHARSSHWPAPCPSCMGTSACPAHWGGTGGRPREPRACRITYLSFQVSGLIRRGSWEDSRVTEAGAKQGPHHKEEEDATDHGDGGGDLHC